MEQNIHADIFIVGAGAAGIAAAVAAARLNRTVIVAERNSFPGGRATASAVGTICGLYLRSNNPIPNFVMNGFPKEFGEHLISTSGKQPIKFSEGLWFNPCLPTDFEKVARGFLDHERITMLYDSEVITVESNEKNITSVRCNQGVRRINISADAFIDCSGNGVLCSAINHSIIQDKEYQAAAIVFSLEKVPVMEEFNLGFVMMKGILKHIELGTIPEYFNLMSVVPGSSNANSILIKMGLPWEVTLNSDIENELQHKAITLVNEVTAFIKNSITGFENIAIRWIAKEVGIRTGVRAMGKKILTDEDVLLCIKQHDGICNGAWPVEYWQTGNKNVKMNWFTENDFYSIPAGCLESVEKENLFFGGKIISAEERAIASARVVGTCLGTGYAAGVLASYKVKNQSAFDAIDFIKQQMLKH